MQANSPPYTVETAQAENDQNPDTVSEPATLTTILGQRDIRRLILRRTKMLPVVAQVSKDFQKMVQEEALLPPALIFKVSFCGCWEWENWFKDSMSNFSNEKGPTNINLMKKKMDHMATQIENFSKTHCVSSFSLNCDAEFIQDILESKFKLVQPIIAARMLYDHYTCMRILYNACHHDAERYPLKIITTVHLHNLYLDNSSARSLGHMLRECKNVTNLTLDNLILHEHVTNSGPFLSDEFQWDDWNYYGESFYNLTAFTVQNFDMVEAPYDTVHRAPYDISPFLGLKSAHKLRSLTIHHCNLSNTIPLELCFDQGDIKRLTSLSKLDLSNNNISSLVESEEDNPWAREMQSVPNLKTIILKNNAFDEQSINYLSSKVLKLKDGQNNLTGRTARLIMK